MKENYWRLALAYAVIGDKEKTYQNLRKYLKTGNMSINVFKSRDEPDFDHIMTDLKANSPIDLNEL